MHRLLIKFVANGLKEVLGKLIAENQNAFMKRRHILHAILIANKAQSIQCSKAQSKKFDMEKAYDHAGLFFI